MNESMAYLSIILCILVGFAHSIPGEKYILIRLFKRNNLPKLFGSDYFTIRTLRFAWHLTTFSWFGFAAILWAIAFKTSLTNEFILNIYLL